MPEVVRFLGSLGVPMRGGCEFAGLASFKAAEQCGSGLEDSLIKA